MSTLSPFEAEKKLVRGIAVIPGAGGGIGAAFAKQAAHLGMPVYVTGRTIPNTTAVAKQIEESGGSTEAVQVDVSK